MTTSTITNSVNINNERTLKQNFTMTSDNGVSLMSFNNGTDELASIVRDKTNANKLFLKLKDEVLEKFPEQIKNDIFGMGGKKILDIAPLSDEATPIEIDNKSGEIRVEINAKDGSKKYICKINAVGIELEYDGNKTSYSSQNEDGSEKAINVTMSSKCFERLISQEDGFIKLKNITANSDKLTPAKIPSFMLGTYLDVIDNNNEAGSAPKQTQTIDVNNQIQAFAISLPRNEGNESYYFWKNEDGDAYMFNNGHLTRLESLALLATTDDEGALKEPYLALGSGLKRGRPVYTYISLPTESKVENVNSPNGKSTQKSIKYLPNNYAEIINELYSFTGLTPPEIQEGAGTISIGQDDGNKIIAEISDSKNEAKFKTKTSSKRFNLTVEEDKQVIPPKPQPRQNIPPHTNPKPIKEQTGGPNPKEPTKKTLQNGIGNEIDPFSPTPLKVVDAPKFKLKPEWGSNIMMAGILLMVIAMVFAPAIAATLLLAIGTPLFVGGSWLAVNADRLANPYLDFKHNIIDPLAKHDRELEKAQEAFWENNKEINKANNGYEVSLAIIENDENPNAAFLKELFGDKYEEFISKEGFSAREAFANDLDKLLQQEGLTDDKRDEFLKKYFGATGAFGKAGIDLTTEQLNALRNHMFNADAPLNDSLKQIRDLNAAQERLEYAQQKSNGILSNYGEDLFGKILSNKNLSAEDLSTVVEQNALAFAKHIAYRNDFNEQQINKLLEKLPEPALTSLQAAISQIENAQKEVEGAAQFQASSEDVIKNLNAYQDAILDTRTKQIQDSDGKRSNFVSNDELSGVMQAVYSAVALENAKTRREDLDKLFALALNVDEGTAPAKQPIAEILSGVASHPVTADVIQKIQKRDQLLYKAGFYADMARKHAQDLNMNDVIGSTLNNQIGATLREELLDLVKNDPKYEIYRNMKTTELFTTLQSNGVIDKGSKAEKLHAAYEADRNVNKTMQDNLNLSGIADKLNKNSTGKTYVSDGEVDSFHKTALKTYPKLKNYNEIQQKAIIKLALIMDTQRQNIISSVSDTSMVMDMLDSKSKDMSAISLLLDGKFEQVVKDEYIRRAYEGTTSLNQATSALKDTVKLYNEHTAPILAKLSHDEKKAVNEQDAGSWKELDSAIQKVVGNEILPDGRTFEEFSKLKTTLPEAALSKEEKLKQIEKTRKTKYASISKLSDAYIESTHRQVEKAIRTLGKKETQGIYTETKKDIKNNFGHALDQKTLNAEEEYHESSSSAAFVRKVAKNSYSTLKNKEILDRVIEIIKTVPNDNNGQSVAHAISQLKESIDNIAQNGLTSEQLKELPGLSTSDVQKILKEMNIPLPKPEKDGHYDWNAYIKRLETVTKERAKALKNEQKTFESSILGQKRQEARQVGRKRLRKNLNKTKDLVKNKQAKFKKPEAANEAEEPVLPAPVRNNELDGEQDVN